MRIYSKLYHAGLLAMVLFVAVGCKDDEETYIDIPVEDVFTLTRDSVQVDFHLVNEHGDTTTVFNEGEDIIFDLRITNQADVYRNISIITDLFTDDLFRVYTSKGKDVGKSYHFNENMFGDGDKDDGPYCRFQPFASFHFQCSWNGNKNIGTDTPFLYNASSTMLDRGSYYTVATVRIGQIMKGYKRPETPDEDEIVGEIEYVGIPFLMTCGIHFQIK